MDEYEERVTQLTLVPKGEPIFHERGCRVEIDDEAGGEFVVVRSNDCDGKITIDPSDWPALRHTIDRMIKGCFV